jgi:serine phosphatase RsbU (regulator of sigma subunit)
MDSYLYIGCPLYSLEVVKNSQSMTAETLLEEINRKVNEFAGNAPQHDDITIIAVQ